MCTALWLAGPKRVRQQSIRYGTYVQDFAIDLAEVLKIVDYGDAEIPSEASLVATVDNILAAQAAVEKKVGDAIDAGAIPIVIGQNSPCGSYATAKLSGDRAAHQEMIFGARHAAQDWSDDNGPMKRSMVPTLALPKSFRFASLC